VVEALEATHVADGGVGDDHAFEALGDLGRRPLDRLDLGDPHEVAHRHQPDEHAFVDDGDVPVAVLGEGGERVGDFLVGGHRVRVRGHPLGNRVARGVGAVGRDADHVAFGEDSDRLVAVDDHDRADLALAHPGGGLGDGLRGDRRDDRAAHDLGDRARPGNVSCGHLLPFYLARTPRRV
jgi:hypothetical protein